MKLDFSSIRNHIYDYIYKVIEKTKLPIPNGGNVEANHFKPMHFIFKNCEDNFF